MCWALLGIIWLLSPKKIAATVYERGLLVWAAAAARGHSAMPGSLTTPQGFEDLLLRPSLGLDLLHDPAEILLQGALVRVP